jgi:hypothetical protein
MLFEIIRRDPSLCTQLYSTRYRKFLLDSIPCAQKIINLTEQGSPSTAIAVNVPSVSREAGEGPAAAPSQEHSEDGGNGDRFSFFTAFGFASTKPCIPGGTVVRYHGTNGAVREAVVESMIGCNLPQKSQYAILIGFRAPGVSCDDAERIFGSASCFVVNEIGSDITAASCIHKFMQMYTGMWGEVDPRIAMLAVEDDPAYKLQVDAYMQVIWTNALDSAQHSANVAVRHVRSGTDSRRLARCRAALRGVGFGRKEVSQIGDDCTDARAAQIIAANNLFRKAVRSSVMLHPTGTMSLVKLYEDFMRMECGINVQRYSM